MGNDDKLRWLKDWRVWTVGCALLLLLLTGCVTAAAVYIWPEIKTIITGEETSVPDENWRPAAPQFLRERDVFPTQRPARYLSQWPVIDVETAQLFRRREYAELEELARELRATGEHDPDGILRLENFYRTLTEPYTVCEEGFAMYFERLQEWETAFPESITAKIVLAETWQNYASYGRGYGWASSVTDTEWQTFRDRLAESRKYIGQAALLPDTCPELGLVRLGNALYEGNRDEYAKIFEEVTAQDPHYPGYYRDGAWALLPRWFGRNQYEWEYFVKTAADSVDGPDGGDVLYARVVSYIFTTDYTAFYEQRVSWDRVKSGWERIVKDYPSDWNQQAFSVMACVAGDRETAKRFFPQGDNEFWTTLWLTNAYMRECRSWIREEREQAPPWPGEWNIEY